MSRRLASYGPLARHREMPHRSAMAAPAAPCEPSSPEPGRDAFHRVRDFAGKAWDAVERVPTRFRGARRVNVAGDSLPCQTRRDGTNVSNQDAGVCLKDVVSWWARSWSRADGGEGEGRRPLGRFGAIC